VITLKRPFPHRLDSSIPDFSFFFNLRAFPFQLWGVRVVISGIVFLHVVPFSIFPFDFNPLIDSDRRRERERSRAYCGGAKGEEWKWANPVENSCHETDWESGYLGFLFSLTTFSPPLLYARRVSFGPRSIRFKRNRHQLIVSIQGGNQK